MGKVFFGSGGSDASDTLVGIAWHYHQLRGNVNKVKIIAREQAYHGTSISTASLTGLGGFHKAFPLPMDLVLRTDCPHFYTRALEDEIEADFCSCLIQNIQKLTEREGLVEASRKQGAYLHKKLNTVLSNHPLVGEISGRDLLEGVQLVTDKSSGQLPDSAAKWAQQAAEKIRELGG